MQTHKSLLQTGLVIVLWMASFVCHSAVYQTPQVFLAETFGEQTPSPAAMWIRGDIRTRATEILGHPYAKLRVRYWLQQQRSAWILEEIGKERPITVGLVVNQNQIERIKVLEFRESRGWEVRYPAFTAQFDGIALASGHKLNRHIDGISGATLSVRALKKLARLALYLHQQVVQTSDQ